MTDHTGHTSGDDDPLPDDDPLELMRAEVQRLREDHDLLAALTLPRHLNPDPPLQAATPSTDPTATTGARTSTAWRHMTADAAEQAWTTLVEFVDWLTDRYALSDTLPGCWYRHGAMVEELHALRIAWTGAYTQTASRPFEPASWHDLLARTLTRLRDWDRYGCASGVHRDDLAAIRTKDDGAGDRAAFIAADVTRRHDHR